MNITLDDSQSLDVLSTLITRLSTGAIREVAYSNRAVYCAYYSSDNSLVEYQLFNRSGATILSVHFQESVAETELNKKNETPFDIITRWMERIRKNPRIQDSTARFLSHTT